MINASISGETTLTGRNRLPALLQTYRPAVVVLELGANDGLRGLPLQAVRDNLGAMIDRAQQAGARVLLLGIELPVNYGPHYRERSARRLCRPGPGKAHGAACRFCSRAWRWIQP